jgi:hypothetical protein
MVQQAALAVCLAAEVAVAGLNLAAVEFLA